MVRFLHCLKKSLCYQSSLSTLKGKVIMKKRNINICRSETWMGDNFKEISSILDETIRDFVDKERIINIEVKERGGLSRFWIYSEEI